MPQNDMMPALLQIGHDSLLLIALINPLGNIPVYVALTESLGRSERLRVFNLSSLIAMGLVGTMAVAGDWMLRQVFRVTIADFQVAGGVLLFMIAARGVMTSPHCAPTQKVDTDSLALFPFTFPILVGPGAIAVTILAAQQSGAWVALATALFSYGLVWCVMRASPYLTRALGRLGGLLVARILYIFLAAKAASLAMRGIHMTFGG